MRHATQARFDRVARGELQRPAYTEAQMLNWTETDWNWHMRMALQAYQYNTFHIREASETGVADLIVYSTVDVVLPLGTAVPRAEGRRVIKESCSVQVIEAWIELKTNNSKSESNIRPGQREFMREHWNDARNALFMMFDRKACMLAAHQGDLTGVVKMLPMSPYSVDWPAVFSHFKSRC